MKILATITIPNISPQTPEHAQHVLSEDTKYRNYTIEVIREVDDTMEV